MEYLTSLASDLYFLSRTQLLVFKKFDYQKMNMFSPFDVWKNDVRIGCICNLVNLGISLLGSMFYVGLLEAKNRMLEFDYE